MKMGMKLYGIAASTCTARVMACLYEKGIDFELIPVNMGAREHKQPTFLNKNPFGQIPALEDRDLTLFGVLPKYFSSEWSVAQFRLLEGSQYIVAFGHQKNIVVILGLDGSFYRCQFDPVSGGEMTQLEYHNFLRPEEAF